MKGTLETGHSNLNVHPDKQSEEIFGTCAQSQTYHIIIKSFTRPFSLGWKNDVIFEFLDIVDYPCLSLAPGQVTSHHFFFLCVWPRVPVLGGGAAPPNLIIGRDGSPRSYAHMGLQANVIVTVPPGGRITSNMWRGQCTNFWTGSLVVTALTDTRPLHIVC